MKEQYKVTEELAQKVLTTVNAGLVRGLGTAKPGSMCVEAAVCYAMGLPHSDKPTCVGESVRHFKIRLNDAAWSSDQARTDGMRKLAIAQLGSNSIDQKQFAKIVAEQSIRRIVPIALRAAASCNPKHAIELETSAQRCEKEGTGQSAKDARAVARKAAAAAADAYAAAAAAAAADAYAAAAADAYAAAAAAAAAAADAYAAAAAAAAADAYAAAAAAADAAAYADARKAKRDEVLAICADIGLQALIQLKSPGCEFLYLTENA